MFAPKKARSGTRKITARPMACPTDHFQSSCATTAIRIVVIAMVVGMRAAESELVELVQSMRASPVQMFFKVRMPCSLPFFFAGLKTAAAFALVGAVVGEWVGADKGLGFLLVIANADLNTRLTFAVLILLMLYGFLWFSLVALVERVCIPWHVSVRNEELSVTL